MKAKLLLMLLMSLLSLGIFASENCNNKCRLRLFVKDKLDTSMKRSLIRPFAQVEDINACLYITFQQSFENVDITIRDKEGNDQDDGNNGGNKTKWQLTEGCKQGLLTWKLC